MGRKGLGDYVKLIFNNSFSGLFERERERTWSAGGDKRERWREKGGDPSTAHTHAVLPKPNPSPIYFPPSNPNPTL